MWDNPLILLTLMLVGSPIGIVVLVILMATIDRNRRRKAERQHETRQDDEQGKG